MITYLVIILVAAVATYLSVPVVRLVAMRSGALTPLRARDVHITPTPRLGGVAMLVGVAVSFLVASGTPFLRQLFHDSKSAWAVLASAALVCLVGVVDDVFELDAITKLSAQVLAAGLMAWQGVQLVSLPLAGVTVGSGGTFLALTVFVVVLMMNAVNFIDGLDGLAAGVIGIVGTAFFLYTYVLSQKSSPLDFSSLASVIAASLVGSCLGFLPHNLYPARIFMGDSGSLLIGLLLSASAVAVTGQVDPTMVSDSLSVPAYVTVLLPAVVILIPVFDLTTAVVRRVRRGQSPFEADRQHLHHRLLNLGHSHPHAVAVMYAWAFTLSFGVVLLAWVPAEYLIPYWVLSVLGSALWTVYPRLRPRPGRHHRSRS